MQCAGNIVHNFIYMLAVDNICEWFRIGESTEKSSRE